MRRPTTAPSPAPDADPVAVATSTTPTTPSSTRPSARLVAALAAGAVILTGSGVALATVRVTRAGHVARAVPADRHAGDATPATAAARPPAPTPARAAALATATTAVAPRPTSRAVTSTAAAPRIAPLRALTAPDLLVTLPVAASPAAVTALRHVAGVRTVAVLDRGTVTVPGAGRLRAVGLDPSEARGLFPKFTAASTPLWQSVAKGELTIGYAAAAPLRRKLGATLPLRTPAGATVPTRLGAFASLGVADAQALVSHAEAARLGLADRRALVVAAPSLSLAELRGAVHRVFGVTARTSDLRPAVVDQSVISAYARSVIPSSYLRLYREAASTCPGMPWTVLAAIGAVETGHGADTSTSSKGAMGPMQFLPSTFVAYAVDGDGDGVADIRDPADAVYSAARYLCASGAGRGGQSLYDAIFAYNHADWYVREVVALAVRYS